MISLVEFDKEENIIDIINYRDIDEAYYCKVQHLNTVSIETLWYNLTTFGILYADKYKDNSFRYLVIDMDNELRGLDELMRRIKVFSRNQKINDIL